MLTSQCERDSNPQLWCEENAEWGEPQLLPRLGRCAVRESHKHICVQPSHPFILPRIHTQPCACAKRLAWRHTHSLFTETQTNVNSCKLTKHGSQQNRKIGFSTSLSTCPLQKKSRHAAFTQQQQHYLLLNNTVPSLCDKLHSAYNSIWALRRLHSYSDCRDYSSTLKGVLRPFLRMSSKPFQVRRVSPPKGPCAQQFRLL